MRSNRSLAKPSLVFVGFFLLAVVGMSFRGLADWREVCETSLACLVDSQQAGERVVIAQLDSSYGVAPAEFLHAYAYCSHSTWLSGAMESYRSSLTEWSLPISGWSFRRDGESVWEEAIPYLAFANAVIVRCRISDIPYIALLPAVAAVYDGESSISVLSGGLGASGSTLEDTQGTLGSRLGTTVARDELNRLIATLGWIPISASTIAAAIDDPLSVTSLSAGLASLPDSDCQFVGLATEAHDAMMPVPGQQVPWIEDQVVNDVRRFSGSINRAEFLQCVDAALQVDATSATLGTIAMDDRTLSVALFWRSGVPSAIASSSPMSTVAPAEYPTTPGVAPGDVAGTKGAHDDSVVVTWLPSASAGLYEVFRADPADLLFRPIGITEETQYVDTRVEWCEPHVYGVRVVSENVLGEMSALVSGSIGDVPEIVHTVDASAGTQESGIVVRWSSAVGATDYILFRCEPVDSPTQRKSKVYAVYRGLDTEFLDQDVVPGVTYSYTVVPGNGCGRSAVGNACDLGCASYPTTLRDVVHPPEFIYASLIEPSDHVDVSWSPVTGATGYRIFRASSYDDPYEEIGSTTSTSWSDADAGYCDDQWYRVQALFGNEASGLSVVAHGVCGGKPALPVGVRVSEGIYADTILLEWGAAREATKYWILRATSADGPFARIGETTDLTYVDGGLVPGQVFWYCLEARNDCGGSGWTPVYRGSTSE